MENNTITKEEKERRKRHIANQFSLELVHKYPEYILWTKEHHPRLVKHSK